MTDSYPKKPEASAHETTMERNASLIRHFYDEIFNQGRLDAADDLVSPAFVDHIPWPMPGQATRGPEAVTTFASMYRSAFPDLQVVIDDLMAIDDRVVTRVTWCGTQQGQLMGAEPTGKRIRVSGIDIARVSGGQLVEHWGQMDVLGMLSQLDFIPGM